jgi:hypothetical protein
MTASRNIYGAAWNEYIMAGVLRKYFIVYQLHTRARAHTHTHTQTHTRS